MRTPSLTALLMLVATVSTASTITDLTGWTLLEDPPNAGMTGVVDNASQATLTATGAIPSGTDIGYASVNGADVASSTAGYYFDPASDFEVTIDYDLTLAGLSGAGGIGFGIGEDVAGADSAGVGLGFANPGIGDVLLYGAASRVGNVDQGETLFGPFGESQGRFSVAYDATSGDVTVGVQPGSPGSLGPLATEVLPGLQNLWDDEGLVVSFFLRSQTVSLTSPVAITVPAMSAGTATAVFSNLTVVSGTPIAVIPEPTAVALLSLAMASAASGLHHARG